MQSNRRVNEELVRQVPSPQFTSSWHPINHATLLDAMHQSTDVLGTEVVKETYTMSEDGMNLFGTWQLDRDYKGSPLMVGFRNSMKKMFAVGFAAGRYVLACSNMQFGGDFVDFRKHTSGLDFDELLNLCERSFKQIDIKMLEFANWHESLREYPISFKTAKVLTYDAMISGVFPPSKFNKFLDCHDEERLINGNTLYSFYGGVTRLVRDTSLFNIQQTTRSLNILAKEYQKYLH